MIQIRILTGTAIDWRSKLSILQGQHKAMVLPRGEQIKPDFVILFHGYLCLASSSNWVVFGEKINPFPFMDFFSSGMLHN